MSKKRMIFNIAQAKYFLKVEKVPIIDIGIHYKTGSPFWCFDYEQSKQAMQNWCNRKRK